MVGTPSTYFSAATKSIPIASGGTQSSYAALGLGVAPLSVTGLTNGNFMVGIGGTINDSDAATVCYLSFKQDVGGTVGVAADNKRALIVQGTNGGSGIGGTVISASGVYLVTGTGGVSNTFTLQQSGSSAAGASCSYMNTSLQVLPIN
jgi:hypothetical protein